MDCSVETTGLLLEYLSGSNDGTLGERIALYTVEEEELQDRQLREGRLWCWRVYGRRGRLMLGGWMILVMTGYSGESRMLVNHDLGLKRASCVIERLFHDD
jgi:hypothetical protein